ncbi:MAG: TackOD1 domain-containing metal-binding protein [Gammaproteobacteria bacterium]
MMQATLVSNRSQLAVADGVPPVDAERLKDIRAEEVGFWVLDGRDAAEAWSLLASIRQSARLVVYLKPVLLLCDDGAADEVLLRAVDATMPYAEFSGRVSPTIGERFERIRKFISTLPEHETATDTNLAFKTMRILASRGGRLSPSMTVSMAAGFVYPLLVPLFPREDDSTARALEFLESQRLVKAEFESRAHFCHACGCAFLNFVETCPLCDAAHLDLDELVHHFKCAHTAPMADFRVDGRLVCPKCDLELRHIGVDYDKPSIIYRCRECQHDFQDPAVTTVCYACERTAVPEHQQNREVNSYEVTALGTNAAIFGFNSLFQNLLESEVRLLPYDVFEHFVQVEEARIKRYRVSRSCVLVLDIEDLEDIYLSVGARAGEVFGELSQVFKAVLRESDIVSSRSESVFLALLTETAPEHAERARERLETGIRDLLRSNLDRDPKFRCAIFSIEPGLVLAERIEECVAGAA